MPQRSILRKIGGMYVPELNRESHSQVLHELIPRFGFATLISTEAEDLIATPLPVSLDASRGANGVLRSHMARSNPHWRAFAEGGEALVIFQGPHAYISPSWYVSKVAVPTWNYATVHAYGTPRVLEDDADVATILDQTVTQYEAGFETPWTTSRLPAEAFAGLRKQVVAFEIEITRIEGKWKLGQNRAAADRRSAGEELMRSGDEMGREVGRMMMEAERE